MEMSDSLCLLVSSLLSGDAHLAGDSPELACSGAPAAQLQLFMSGPFVTLMFRFLSTCCCLTQQAHGAAGSSSSFGTSVVM